MVQSDRKALRRALVWWTIFAAAFGYVEAMVVVYIRRLASMAYGAGYPAIWQRRGLGFSSASIASEMHRLGLWNTELTREAATIVLLAAAAIAAGKTVRERTGLFLYTFAVWDLTYYVWLRLWTGFPASLGSTDIYYLVPIAWYGPVWFPVLIFMPLMLAIAFVLLLGKGVGLPDAISSSTDGGVSP